MRYLFILITLVQFAQSQEMFEIQPGLHVKIANDRRIAYAVHEGQMIYFATKDIRALIVITEIHNKQAMYKARIFSIKEKKESKVEGKLEESYEKLNLPNGDVELKDKGSRLAIMLGGESLQWSFGANGKSYVYQRVDNEKLFILDADSFDSSVIRTEVK